MLQSSWCLWPGLKITLFFLVRSIAESSSNISWTFSTWEGRILRTCEKSSSNLENESMILPDMTSKYRNSGNLEKSASSSTRRSILPRTLSKASPEPKDDGQNYLENRKSKWNGIGISENDTNPHPVFFWGLCSCVSSQPCNKLLIILWVDSLIFSNSFYRIWNFWYYILKCNFRWTNMKPNENEKRYLTVSSLISENSAFEEMWS